MLIKAIVLPVTLRFLMMLGTLGAIHLTYILYSTEIFLAVNMLTFLVGMHTAMTYAIQVDIWETGRVDGAKIALALGGGFTIVFVTGIAGLASTQILFAGLIYIFYRFSDRLVFNMLITRGKITQAYSVSIIAILVEILFFCLLIRTLPESTARLLLPSIFSGLFVTAILYFYAIRIPYKSISINGNQQINSILFSLHSAAILFVIMIDRIAPSINSNLDFLDARYLLIFSYSGAIYSLGVAAIEPLRPKYFSIAKEARTFFEFLNFTNSNLFIYPISIFIFILSILFFGISAFYDFSNPKYFYSAARDMQICLGLLIFFSFLFLLMYFQMYFLSRREFAPIFISWGLAFAVRLVAFEFSRVDAYLINSIVSSIIAVMTLFVLSYLKEIK